MARGSFQRLVLLTRKRLPQWLRRLLRLARHALVRGQSSVWLPPVLLDGCRLCASRDDLVSLLPPRGRIAEVGTHRGDFARHILTACAPAELHLIDLDFSFLDPAVARDARVKLHQGMSHEILEGFPADYFDWIYIDADHSYAGTSRDASAAATKVRPGGFLVFNDFAHIDPYLGAYGVHRAVVDFAIKNRWALSWLAYEPSALYDVALRRPE